MGALVEANGIAASEARITMPLVGVWHADLVLLASDGVSVGDAATIAIGSGAWSLSGTVTRARAFDDALRVRVVAGAAGMGTTATAKHYKSAQTRRVVEDVLGAAGETLSGASDSTFLGTILPAWSVFARPCGIELATVVSIGNGLSWRTIADGSVWIGAETWPDSEALGEIQSRDEEHGRIEFECEVPTLQPGETFDGAHIGDVEHVVTATETVTIARVRI